MMFLMDLVSGYYKGLKSSVYQSTVPKAIEQIKGAGLKVEQNGEDLVVFVPKRSTIKRSKKKGALSSTYKILTGNSPLEIDIPISAKIRFKGTAE